MPKSDGVQLKSFYAEGVLGELNYKLKIENLSSIIVGPNGTGKSTFLTLFYLFLSRQWSRLLEYDFKRLVLTHEKGDVEISKADIISLDVIPRQSVRMRSYIDKLVQSKMIDTFMKSTLSKEDRENLGRALSMPAEEIQAFKRYIMREIGINRKALEVDNTLQELDLGYILYMPTYRRIEKDIKSIFPDVEDRFRVRIEENQLTSRAGVNFQEIVSFGMEDIAKIIDDSTREVREFQQKVTESASQSYIRDILRGGVQDYSLKDIRNLEEEFVKDFINRLDDSLFSTEDKDMLRSNIDNMRKRSKGQPNKDMRYLGLFVEKMMIAHIEVMEKEYPLARFTHFVSKYLDVNKSVFLDGMKFCIKSKYGKGDGDAPIDIPLSTLSSGEKQIVSIFAYLMLKRDKRCIVFIDEPELSLSVKWQKEFLPDIVGSGNCQYMFAVTHSPFVFDNNLISSVVDVRKLQVGENG